MKDAPSVVVEARLERNQGVEQGPLARYGRIECHLSEVQRSSPLWGTNTE